MIDNGLQPCGVQPNRQFTDEVGYHFLHVLGELRNDMLWPIQGAQDCRLSCVLLA